jgi:sensor histidine kinase regulating citrate/malate metabolism
MIFLINYKKNKGLDILFYEIIGICVILTVVTAIDIGKHKIKAKETEAELRMYQLYEPTVRTLLEDIRAKQHEFDNHLNTLFSMHQVYKTYEELVDAQREYGTDIMNENRHNKLLKNGNLTFIAFFYTKVLEVEKRGITIDYQMNINELESRVPVYKLVELVGNLVNNAADAVEEKKGRIQVEMLEQKDNIQIEVSNECENIDYEKIDKYFRKGYSEKGENRGYGLYNVKKICDTYGIELSTRYRNEEEINWLTFQLIIHK